jgi:hypothetical protein
MKINAVTPIHANLRTVRWRMRRSLPATLVNTVAFATPGDLQGLRARPLAAAAPRNADLGADGAMPTRHSRTPRHRA